MPWLLPLLGGWCGSFSAFLMCYKDYFEDQLEGHEDALKDAAHHCKML